jgi:hypothetical protein
MLKLDQRLSLTSSSMLEMQTLANIKLVISANLDFGLRDIDNAALVLLILEINNMTNLEMLNLTLESQCSVRPSSGNVLLIFRKCIFEKCTKSFLD